MTTRARGMLNGRGSSLSSLPYGRAGFWTRVGTSRRRRRRERGHRSSAALKHKPGVVGQGVSALASTRRPAAESRMSALGGKRTFRILGHVHPAPRLRCSNASNPRRVSDCSEQGPVEGAEVVFDFIQSRVGNFTSLTKLIDFAITRCSIEALAEQRCNISCTQLSSVFFERYRQQLRNDENRQNDGGRYTADSVLPKRAFLADERSHPPQFRAHPNVRNGSKADAGSAYFPRFLRCWSRSSTAFSSPSSGIRPMRRAIS